MPPVEVVLYQDEAGRVPLLDWIDGLQPKARNKCLVRIERLTVMGYELRRPEADYLRDGIHELRLRHAGIQYRILYFFYGKDTAILSHGIRKQQSRVPVDAIRNAVEHRRRFSGDPIRHTYQD